MDLQRFNPLRILERCEATALGSQSSSSEIWWEAANRRWSWTHKITDPQSVGSWELRNHEGDRSRKHSIFLFSGRLPALWELKSPASGASGARKHFFAYVPRL